MSARKGSEATLKVPGLVIKAPEEPLAFSKERTLWSSRQLGSCTPCGPPRSGAVLRLLRKRLGKTVLALGAGVEGGDGKRKVDWRLWEMERSKCGDPWMWPWWVGQRCGEEGEARVTWK